MKRVTTEASLSRELPLAIIATPEPLGIGAEAPRRRTRALDGPLGGLLATGKHCGQWSPVIPARVPDTASEP